MLEALFHNRMLHLGLVLLTLMLSFALALMAVWCAKTSALPSSGAMNPKPLASLNHFTVPVAILLLSFKVA